MKKVLFVATVVKTHINTFHLPFLKMFHEAGWEVHVAAKNDFSKGEACYIPYCDIYYDVPFERFPFSKKNVIAYRKLKKIMMDNQYDIIHCHTPVGGVLARLAGKYCFHTRMIYTAHGFHFYKGASLINWLLYYPVERICAHYTDILITINHEDYQRARHFTFHDGGKVYYVPGVGIDTHQINEININREIKCKELGISPDTFIILSVGELNKNKNHEIALKAVAKLKNKNFVYLICGQGNLLKYLKLLSKKLGISDNVIFLGYRSDIFEIYKIADIFLFPSFREGLPVAVMEAMATGLPIVCSDIRGNIDLVCDGQNGYLVDCHDVEGFAEKINYLLHRQDVRKQLAINGIKKIQAYSLQSVCAIMKKIYGI